MVGEEKPGIGGVPLHGQKSKPKNSYIPPGMGTHQPAWVAFDKQVSRLQCNQIYPLKKYCIFLQLQEQMTCISKTF